jgi:hypothetical protein
MFYGETPIDFLGRINNFLSDIQDYIKKHTITFIPFVLNLLAAGFVLFKIFDATNTTIEDVVVDAFNKDSGDRDLVKLLDYDNPDTECNDLCGPMCLAGFIDETCEENIAS